MPGNAAAAMAMKRARAKKAKEDAAKGPKQPVVEEEKTEAEAEKEIQKALAAKAKSKKNALKYVRDMGLYVIWVLVFSASIFLSRDAQQAYAFQDLFNTWIVGPGVEIKTVDDLWGFLDETALKVLSDDLYKTLGDDFGSSRDNNFLYGNRRIEQLRIRQVRVPSQMCGQDFLNKILTTESPEYSTIRCYPEFSTSIPLEAEFVKESVTQDFFPDLEAMPWFKFHESKPLREMAFFEGFYNIYPGSGYVLDIDWAGKAENGETVITVVPVDPPRIPFNTTISEVQNSKWIDIKTRAVIVDFTFFNPNLQPNLFLVVRLCIEFLPSGITIMYPTLRIVNPFRFKMQTLMQMITTGLLGVTVLLTLFYSQKEAREILRGPSKYIKSAWSLIAFVNVALMLGVCYFYATNFLQTQALFNPDNEIYQGDLQKLGYALDQEKNLEGLCIIIMWVRLYQYCSISRSLSTLTRTIGKAVGKLAIVMFLLLLPMIGMMFGMVLIVGTNSYNFSSFMLALYTLFRAVLGDFDYSEWGSNRYLGPILLLFWIILTGCLILNIIVALLCDAFASVMLENEEFDEKGIKSVLDIFIESGLLGGRLSAMLNKQAEAAQDMEAALAAIDADGDGMTDIDELTAWMKATGAEQILGMSAMEVMARYDSDGSGQLDQEEMDDIKAWVQREREKAEAAAAKENLAVSDMDYMEDRRAGGAIDTKAVLALVQQAGGGMSLAMEEKILNIENNVIDIKEKMTKLLAKIDSMSTMGMYSSGPAGDSAASRLPGATQGTPTKQAANLKQDGGKLVAMKSLVAEEG